MAEDKLVYFFGNNETDGNGQMTNLLGGKGANLAEMANLGVPVPPGFTISTDVCIYYLKNNKYPDGLIEQVNNSIKKLEQVSSKKFGDSDNPLLLSVRSGAKASMPGMMDTVLNLGLNDESVKGLAKKTDNPRFAYDSYRRFLSMFADVVLGISYNKFEDTLEKKKCELGVKLDTELSVDDLKDIVEKFKSIIKKCTGKPFTQDPKEHLQMAIDAVFSSWNNQRAIKYRNLHGIPHSWGTAVNIQTMVYGNMGETSGTGVAFTRDPGTGEKNCFGEYLINAQGEDVVAGIRTPESIETLEKSMPDVYEQLVDIFNKLEEHFKDMQDIEFTIEEGKLYILQTRTGKRSAASAIRIAVDMVDEGLIDKRTAVMRLEPKQVDQMLHPMIKPDSICKVIATGLAASPGAAVGKVVFSADHAEDMEKKGENTIMVRTETSPEDIGGMHAAEGILTVRGGMTSHAAVVARGMGKPCVAGCSDIVIDASSSFFMVDDIKVKEGDYISIDGTTGRVILGQVEVEAPGVSEYLEVLLKWADEIRDINIRTNADTPSDATTAREFGAEGIGLCRTEHMFFGDDRIPVVREMIMAEDENERRTALAKLQPMQKDDFVGIFKAMKNYPVTIRLLDPPLHEFLPRLEELESKLVKLECDKDKKRKEIKKVRKLIERVEAVKEINPMLGHRGCRLGITFPEIYEMQVKAIIEAACELECDGTKVIPEIMIPLVSDAKELAIVKEEISEVAERVMKEHGMDVEYLIGTMIELPRAALTADKISKHADFFSFGTNDLTQTTFGFSRDDAGKYLPLYIEKQILDIDPFVSLDQEGVGELIKIGIQKGRMGNINLKVGICGEHGGEPTSIKFGYACGLDYVSCSPFRVPIARLAAAQAKIESE